MYGANVGQMGWLKYKATVNQAVCGLIIDPKKADWRYVFYSLLQNRGGLVVQARGAAQQNLNQDMIKSFEVLLPLLPIQKQIANILSIYDDLIENNTKRIKILEEIAQTIYREWFENNSKIKNQNAKSWETRMLGEKFEIVLGGTPSRSNPDYWNGDVPWINSSETNHLRVISPSEFITQEGLSKSAAKLMPKRTTILAITGATLGQVSLLEIECSANQSVVGVYDKNIVYNEYLYLFISSRIADIISKSGGSAQQHINKQIVEDYQILIPPQRVIEEFNRIVRPFFDLLSNLLFLNQNLRKARDLLLPKLITGEIEVKK